MKNNELKEHNGKGGNSSYVAYKGQIYDVSDSKLWKNGTHMARHDSGEDLTEFMSMAPHGPEMLEKFTTVGKLDEDIDRAAQTKDALRAWYRKNHPHPILLHFPMGLFPFGAVMLALFWLTGDTSFEKASFYSLIGGTIFAFPVVVTGLFSWWLNYEMMLTTIFKFKLIFSIILLATSSLAAVLRLISPEIVVFEDTGIIYLASYLLCIPSLFIIAFNGGKITWPS